MSDPIRIGVVGYGFGQHHVRTLALMPGVKVVAVADRRSPRLDEAAGQYGFTPYRDALAMIEQERLDAVTICTSPKARGPLLEAAASRSLPMFVEKPWAADARQAREYAAICAASTAPVMVGFSFRFHPAIVRLRQLLDSELGQPRMLNGQYVFGWLPSADKWMWDPQNGNGFLNENSCHLLDAVCSLMGRPTRVTAEAERFCQRPMEDAAAVTLRFASAGIATLVCGGIGAGAFADFPRIDLFTERGQAHLQGRNHVWDSLQWATCSDATVHRIAANPEQLGSTRYTDAFNHFVQCLRDGTAPRATVEDGVLAVDLAMAIVESARCGRTINLETREAATVHKGS